MGSHSSVGDLAEMFEALAGVDEVVDPIEGQAANQGGDHDTYGLDDGRPHAQNLEENGDGSDVGGRTGHQKNKDGPGTEAPHGQDNGYGNRG